MSNSLNIVMNVFYSPTTGLRDYIEKNSSIVIPIIGGAAKNEYCTDDWCRSHLMRDDSGENITEMNSRYNEFTSIYWYWKNELDERKPEYVGFNHYRRFFDIDETLDCLGDFDVITAKPFPMVYNTPATGSVQSDIEGCYRVFHSHVDWLEMELEMTRRGYDMFNWKRLPFMPHPCNMFVMRRDIFDEYCTFMFDMLGCLNPRIDTDGRDNYQKRAMAFLSERLTSFWIHSLFAARRIRLKEIDTIFRSEWKDNGFNERGTY